MIRGRRSCPSAANGPRRHCTMESLAQRISAFLVLVAAVSCCYGSAKPQQCTRGCLVDVEGLQGAYSPGSHSDLFIHNRSKHTLDLNVAIEGLNGGSWHEIAGSISDSRHSFSKVVVLRSVKPGASLALVFAPCETLILIRSGDSLAMSEHPCSGPAGGADMPTSLRLRVDVFAYREGRILQQVRSQEFKLIPGAEPH
jgi:hypothetical protein